MVKAGKQINTFEHSPDNQPKNPHLSEDFEMWLKGREKQKNFLEKKNHLDAQSQLADLKETLGKKPPEKIGGTSQRNSLTPKRDTVKSSTHSVALTDTILTRQIGDGEKGILDGISELAFVPLSAFKNTIIDAGRIVFSPLKEIQRTIAYLQEESSAKII